MLLLTHECQHLFYTNKQVGRLNLMRGIGTIIVIGLVTLRNKFTQCCISTEHRTEHRSL